MRSSSPGPAGRSWPARPGARRPSPARSRSCWRARLPPGGARAGRACPRAASVHPRPGHAAPIQPACGSRSATTSTRRSMTPAAGNTRSVLLAEHEPEVAEMSARYLRRDGLRVRLVTTPEQALAELTAGPDAVAVLDLTMPGLDPRRIRRALRTPVIFLVAGLQGPRPRGLARGGGSGPPRGAGRAPRPPARG